MRVAVVVVTAIAASCGGETAEPTSTSTSTSTSTDILLAQCGSRGAPVTLAKLVKVLRANGITLDIHRRGCQRPESDPNHPDATNAGPSGLDPQPGVFRREGHVLCDVARVPHASNRDVKVVKYANDVETQVGVLNVGCALYPSDAASEARQVNRLKKALKALSRMT